jgi:hypothetical protein
VKGGINGRKGVREEGETGMAKREGEGGREQRDAPVVMAMRMLTVSGLLPPIARERWERREGWERHEIKQRNEARETREAREAREARGHTWFGEQDAGPDAHRRQRGEHGTENPGFLDRCFALCKGGSHTEALEGRESVNKRSNRRSMEIFERIKRQQARGEKREPRGMKQEARLYHGKSVRNNCDEQRVHLRFLWRDTLFS